MNYQTAQDLAFQELKKFTQQEIFTVKLLTEEYKIDLDKCTVINSSTSISDKDYLTILILHYLIAKAKGIPSLKQVWVNFRQIPGGEGYYPTYTKRVILPLKRKFEKDGQSLINQLKSYDSIPAGYGDVSLIIPVLEQVPVLFVGWKGDEEFNPELNLLYDASIPEILPTEDIVVLSEHLVYSLH